MSAGIRAMRAVASRRGKWVCGALAAACASPARAADPLIHGVRHSSPREALPT
jgi:hypothetical protein